jgi:TolB-like protein/Tfp pilus assembly protein PilF
MPDIFLSYNREDQAVARRFADAFTAQGFNVWWDVTLRSGEAYDEVTEKALRDAKAVVVLWSKKSVVSRWVRAEATLADRNKTLVPVMIEPCERPIMFELTQTAELGHWSGDDNDPIWRAFLVDVRAFVNPNVAGVAVASSVANTVLAATHAIAALQPPQHQDLRPSLAILPFTNRSGEHADDVFAEGMVEDLISSLSLNNGLKVIAHSATVVYRNNLSDLRKIGSELNVRYLLEGNVRRVQTNLRVTAQLVEAEGGTILWSQKFERPLTELADLQEDLVMEVAAHLGVQVERIEMEKALRKPGNLTAWEAVMRAMAAFTRLSIESLRLGTLDARKAVALAPDYAFAHAMLALMLGHAYMWGGGKDKALAHEALTHAERALTLDSDDANVMSRAAMGMAFSGRWEQALVYGQLAAKLNPNNAQCRIHLGMLYLHCARPEDTLIQLDAAVILAPRGQQTYLSYSHRALAHLQAGRYQQALEANDLSLALNPVFLYTLKDRVVFYEKLGMHAEAQATMRHLRNHHPDVTLADLDAHHRASFIAPATAEDIIATLHKVWQEAAIETAAV